MALLALLSNDHRLVREVPAVLDRGHMLAATPCWDGLRRLVRERPVAAALVDLATVVRQRGGEEALIALRRDFPSLGLVVLASRADDPMLLFRLGRAGIRNLLLLAVDDLQRDLGRTVVRACGEGASSLVLRAVSPQLPRWETEALQLAIEGLPHRWSAEDYAECLGLSRPHLSQRFRACGLPSVGHLLVWARLFHAGQWLREPGRTAESVSRQLEYSSGAAFRRALKGYTGATPSDVVDQGGVTFVLDCFMDECGFRSPVAPARISVA